MEEEWRGGLSRLVAVERLVSLVFAFPMGRTRDGLLGPLVAVGSRV